MAVAQQGRLGLAGGTAGKQPDGHLVRIGMTFGGRRRRRHPLGQLVLGHDGDALDAGEAGRPHPDRRPRWPARSGLQMARKRSSASR